MKKFNSKMFAADLAECALFAALMVVGAFLQINLPPVPITFQTFFAVSAGLLLGWKKGAISMAVYLVMGLVGIPVFSSGGGIMYVLKPAFGYIVGFIAAAAVAGVCYNRPKKLWQYIILALLAMLVNYAIGIAYFIAVWQLNGYEGLWSAVVTYNLMYIPKDVLLCIVSAIISWRVTPAIKKLTATHTQKGNYQNL